MKVYLVEHGVYEQAYIEGVYSTLEKAMARYPERKDWECSPPVEHRGAEWDSSGEPHDWSDAVRIMEYEVQE